MKTVNVPLDKIVWNPYRDMDLYPLDADHITDLLRSIKDHGFFGGVKARLRNGMAEIGCGHHRIEAARQGKLGSVEIRIDDIDDDDMIRLMTVENATQSGSHPGAILNEVAAVTRRLVEIIVASEKARGIHQTYFDSAQAFGNARGKLLARLNDPDKDGGIGRDLILRYLGRGDVKDSPRSEQQIREAIATLKQSGRYDDIVDDALHHHAPQVIDAAPANGTAVKTTAPRKPRKRVIDDRCANLFPNDHQFHAFRDAVTTEAAQRAIPPEKQYDLAKRIMNRPPGFSKKQTGAPYIKMMVQSEVQEFLKRQHQIDREERERYLAEQMEARIDAELYTAKASLRSLISALGKIEQLAAKFPQHPKLGGFSARLDVLVTAINQLSKKLK